MHWAVKPHPHHLRDATGIVAVSLVDLRLQHRPHVPRLDTDHRQASFCKRAKQPLRQRTSFQSNALEVVSGSVQHRQECLRFTCCLHFPNGLARIIHNANARRLDRNVQSSKIVHAALLLLMLGARTTVTPFHHQPEAQHPKIFQLSTSRWPITPSFGVKVDMDTPQCPLPKRTSTVPHPIVTMLLSTLCLRGARE